MKSEGLVLVYMSISVLMLRSLFMFNVLDCIAEEDDSQETTRAALKSR